MTTHNMFRIRLGILILPIAGLLFTIGYFLSGGLPNPTADANGAMASASSTNYLVGNVLNLLALALLPLGLLALYAGLASSRVDRTAFVGMVLGILGLNLTIGAFGVLVFDFPVLGQLYVRGDDNIPEVAASLFGNPVLFAIFTVSGLFYFGGSLLFGIAIWGSQLLPRLSGILLASSGFFLAFGPALPMPPPVPDVIGAVLLFLGGSWIALNMWRSAGGN